MQIIIKACMSANTCLSGYAMPVNDNSIPLHLFSHIQYSVWFVTIHRFVSTDQYSPVLQCRLHYYQCKDSHNHATHMATTHTAAISRSYCWYCSGIISWSTAVEDSSLCWILLLGVCQQTQDNKTVQTQTSEDGNTTPRCIHGGWRCWKQREQEEWVHCLEPKDLP